MKTSSPMFRLSFLRPLTASALCWLALASTAHGQGGNPLRIFCPPDQTHWICGGSSTTPVTYPAPATTGANCSFAPSVTCRPPSGALFPLGTTTVTCTATNRCGEAVTCAFRVTVARDTAPPVLTCPSNLVFNCLCPGQIINLDFFQPTATDNHDPSPTIVCNPPSLVSSPGVHVVTCTATDNCTNRSVCTFTVTVINKNGVLILFSANSSAGGGAVAEGFVYRLSIPGTYYVRVRSAATASGTGTYRVMVAHCGLPPTAGLGIVHRGGRLTLSWPAAHEPSLLRSSRDLRTWTLLDLTPTADGDELRAELPATPPHQFFQLVPAGGWSNDTYHCCDANGQNCSEAVNPLTICIGGIKVRCYETENSSVCEP